MIAAASTMVRAARVLFFFAIAGLSISHISYASEVGQGTFHTTLSEHPTHCTVGNPITTAYTNTFVFDDKTFNVNLPPGNNLLSINFSLLGTFLTDGTLNCVFDEGGTFDSTAVNEVGDFQWTTISGEYMDRVPGIQQGDPFPFVGSARCTTTRTDDFRTLCDNFEFSFNGLSKALEPNAENAFHDFAGDFTMRTALRVPVDPSGAPDPKVDVVAPVDGPAGHIPEVAVTFGDGVLSSGELAVATLADAHGSLPAGLELPVLGTTTIDHGTGPITVFEGGDERFLEISTTADLPPSPVLEVCLPMPPLEGPSDVRPVYVLHGEGADPTTRVFVDRTSRVDPIAGKACAAVESFSRFAVATSDVCGNGRRQSDGLITIAGGLRGRKTVIVDGLTDCALYPANLPRRLAPYCVPDADSVPGQCTVSLVVGVNRAGCNRITPGTTAYSPAVDVSSYSGNLRHGSYTTDLTALVGTAIAGLNSPQDATVGPFDVALPLSGKMTTYKLRHELSGVSPTGSGDLDRDRDALLVRCIDPTQF